MEKSQSVKEIAKAISTFHLKVSKVKKDASNPFFKSKYASLSNILDVIEMPLLEAGLAFSQLPCGENGLVTILIHTESGEYLQSEYSMRPVKDDPQGRGSSITYQRRYALAAILGLNIDEDDDGNRASQPPKKEDKKDWINPGTESWTKAIKWVLDGKGTVEKLADRLSVTNKIKFEQELQSQIK